MYEENGLVPYFSTSSSWSLKIWTQERVVRIEFLRTAHGDKLLSQDKSPGCWLSFSSIGSGFRQLLCVQSKSTSGQDSAHIRNPIFGFFRDAFYASLFAIQPLSLHCSRLSDISTGFSETHIGPAEYFVKKIYGRGLRCWTASLPRSGSSPSTPSPLFSSPLPLPENNPPTLVHPGPPEYFVKEIHGGGPHCVSAELPKQRPLPSLLPLPIPISTTNRTRFATGKLTEIPNVPSSRQSSVARSEPALEPVSDLYLDRANDFPIDHSY